MTNAEAARQWIESTNEIERRNKEIASSIAYKEQSQRDLVEATTQLKSLLDSDTPMVMFRSGEDVLLVEGGNIRMFKPFDVSPRGRNSFPEGK